MKITVVLIAVFIAIKLEPYLSDFGKTIGFLVGLAIGGMIIQMIERLAPYFERIDKHAKTFNDFRYTEKYGIDYPRPNPKDFGITDGEFKDYRNRFQFELLKLIFSYGVLIVAFVIVIKWEITGFKAFLLLGGAGVLAIFLHSLFNHLNKKISQRHHAYNKIHKFQEAYTIHCKIREENSPLLN